MDKTAKKLEIILILFGVFCMLSVVWDAIAYYDTYWYFWLRTDGFPRVAAALFSFVLAFILKHIDYKE